MIRNCSSFLCGFYEKNIINEPDTICNIFSNQNKLKWVFSNGTVVVASNIKNAQTIIAKILNNTNNYYAYNLNDDLWNVQFTNEIFPILYVNVEAINGEKAYIKAIESLKKDLNTLDVIDIIVD